MNLCLTDIHVNSIEIIETYWNVNFERTISIVLLCTEIIETYWNVNELLEGMSAEGIEGK